MISACPSSPSQSFFPYRGSKQKLSAPTMSERAGTVVTRPYTLTQPIHPKHD